MMIRTRHQHQYVTASISRTYPYDIHQLHEHQPPHAGEMGQTTIQMMGTCTDSTDGAGLYKAQGVQLVLTALVVNVDFQAFVGDVRSI